jgi:Family of unknown function (DUF6535)
VDTYDYTEVFPKDEPYTEMGPHARVWKVYNEEMAKVDMDRIEDWRDSLDSLLVFVCIPVSCPFLIVANFWCMVGGPFLSSYYQLRDPNKPESPEGLE